MSPIASERPEGIRNAARIERRAKKIDDPIERLKYLRVATEDPPAPRRQWGPIIALAMVALPLTMRSDAHLRHQPEIHHSVASLRVKTPELPNIWRVEAGKDFEVYSNGLRIDNQLSVSNHPRSYQFVSVKEGLVKQPSASITQPSGIVFHTTESHQVPFEAPEQRNLQRITRETLLFVRNKRAYHFVIDRFGRVHRIVAESDAANHAGNSVWADSKALYLELNQSFLSIAFEASMQTDQPPINDAQIHSGKVLTEMLRSKYKIAAENCVTHAQVSVNPGNMRIGWHCDWGKDFPFQQMGLPENYELPLPSLFLLGFDYDPVYINATGAGIWKGLALAEERTRDAAGAKGIAIAVYQAHLRKRYRDEITALRNRGADQEN
jgi:hypothetical protein